MENQIKVIIRKRSTEEIIQESRPMDRMEAEFLEKDWNKNLDQLKYFTHLANC